MQTDSKPQGPAGKDLPAQRSETLSRMIEHLEEQLDQMIAGNEGLQTELEEERRRRSELQKVVDELRQQIERREGLATAHEQLMAELTQLKGERTRLDAKAQDLERQLAAAEQERKQRRAWADRMSTACDEAAEDVQAVEAQFERAMQMVTALKAQVTVLSEERDALLGRARVADEEVRKIRKDRDSLAAEVEESRAALDEIRRSLTDACLTTPKGGAGSRGADSQ